MLAKFSGHLANNSVGGITNSLNSWISPWTNCTVKCKVYLMAVYNDCCCTEINKETIPVSSPSWPWYL